MSDFIERRKITPVESAIIVLSNDLNNLRESVKTDLQDYSKRLDVYIEHSDAIQRQVQESLQRQLDQNQEQHREMMENGRTSMTIFKDTMERFVTDASQRIDAITEQQRLEDIDRNKRISALENGPGKNAFKQLYGLKIAIITGVSVLAATSFAIFAFNFVSSQIKLAALPAITGSSIMIPQGGTK
jgi:hypothetical protein